MKPVLFIFLLSLTVSFIVVYSIHWYIKRADAVPQLEGMYIRHSQHEFGNEWDTLLIKEETAPVNHFLITRRWRYERMLDGTSVQPEYKRISTSAQLLEKEGLLVENETGIRYALDEKKKILLAGATVYQKVK